MDDKEIDAYCAEWIEWCRTRKYYIPPGAKNILARLQPRTGGEPPDGKNSADMQYFNMAVHTLADMAEHKAGFLCFWVIYIEQSPNIKRKAAEMDISRTGYYKRAKAFARRAFSMSQSLKRASEQAPACCE